MNNQISGNSAWKNPQHNMEVIMKKTHSFHFTGAIALIITLASCAVLTAPRDLPPPKAYVPDEPVFAHQKGTFTDQRDGKTYETVEIGTQTWMAENLNYNAQNSKCYGDDEANCQEYGRLYNWSTAVALTDCNDLNKSCLSQISEKHKGVCPDGWHIPRDAEWATLVGFAGANAGIRLKASRGWSVYKGSDSYGFAALPGGSYGFTLDGKGSFYDIGKAGLWWTSTSLHGMFTIDYTYSYEMNDNGYVYKRVSQKTNSTPDLFYSVRCVQD